MMSFNTTPTASCPSLTTLQEAEPEAPQTGRAPGVILVSPLP